MATLLPSQHTCPDWNWTAEHPVPEFKPGDDVEVMFHGGSTARGNLYNLILPGYSVMAWRVHGQVHYGDMRTRRRLAWVEESRADLRLVG